MRKKKKKVRKSYITHAVLKLLSRTTLCDRRCREVYNTSIHWDEVDCKPCLLRIYKSKKYRERLRFDRNIERIETKPRLAWNPHSWAGMDKEPATFFNRKVVDNVLSQ